jgi:hypothetical protein
MIWERRSLGTLTKREETSSLKNNFPIFLIIFLVSESLEPSTFIYKQAIDARNRLIEQLAETDDEVAEAFLNGKCFLFLDTNKSKTQ